MHAPASSPHISVAHTTTGTSSTTTTTVAPDHEAAFIANLPVVRDVIRGVCRRFRVSADEEPEFASSVMLKLIDNDYEVFRRFRGDSGLRTFLFAVAARHLLDRRNSEWGKWRPSRCARRLGSAAIQLERLVYCERTAVSEAIAMVSHHPQWGLNTGAVRNLFAQLPTRAVRFRKPEPLDLVVGQIPDGDLNAADRDERRHDAARMRVALTAALRRLDPSERQLLRMRFMEGRSIPQIAELTGEDAHALYRRLPRIFRRLRAELQTQELTGRGVSQMLGHAGDELDSLLARTWETPACSPRYTPDSL